MKVIEIYIDTRLNKKIFLNRNECRKIIYVIDLILFSFI